jgi:hypothetical protein
VGADQLEAGPNIVVEVAVILAVEGLLRMAARAACAAVQERGHARAIEMTVVRILVAGAAAIVRPAEELLDAREVATVGCRRTQFGMAFRAAYPSVGALQRECGEAAVVEGARSFGIEALAVVAALACRLASQILFAFAIKHARVHIGVAGRALARLALEQHARATETPPRGVRQGRRLVASLTSGALVCACEFEVRESRVIKSFAHSMPETQRVVASRAAALDQLRKRREQFRPGEFPVVRVGVAGLAGARSLREICARKRL